MVLLNIFLIMDFNNVSGYIETRADDVFRAEDGCRCFQEEHLEVLNHFSHPQERLHFCSCFAFYTEKQEVSWYPRVPEKKAEWLMFMKWAVWHGVFHCREVVMQEVVTQFCIPGFLKLNKQST